MSTIVKNTSASAPVFVYKFLQCKEVAQEKNANQTGANYGFERTSVIATLLSVYDDKTCNLTEGCFKLLACFLIIRYCLTCGCVAREVHA